MDISNYKIRVIRTEAKDRGGVPIAASSQFPIDIEGSLLSISCMSNSAKEALLSRDWFKIFFGGLSIYATVRWDNDHKCSAPITKLTICSFGTLPMCWPLYAPPKSEFSHKFDNRRAEERCPRTVSVATKKPILKKEQLNIVDIDFTDLEQKYSDYIQHAESDSKYKKNIKNFSLQYAAYNMLHSGTETKFNAIINQY